MAPVSFGELIARGATHAYSITQVTNKAVVHGFERLGFKFGKAEHTMRRVL